MGRVVLGQPEIRRQPHGGQVAFLPSRGRHHRRHVVPFRQGAWLAAAGTATPSAASSALTPRPLAAPLVLPRSVWRLAKDFPSTSSQPAPPWPFSRDNYSLGRPTQREKRFSQEHGFSQRVNLPLLPLPRARAARCGPWA